MVVLAVGDNKINMIKQVRATFGLGLKEAKDIVDQPTPFIISKRISKTRANQIGNELQAVKGGIKIEVQDQGTPILPVAVKSASKVKTHDKVRENLTFKGNWADFVKDVKNKRNATVMTNKYNYEGDQLKAFREKARKELKDAGQ